MATGGRTNHSGRLIDSGVRPRAYNYAHYPHICTLHDVGPHDGVDFLGMQLREGETGDFIS
jgi:hypothetical protein